MADKKPEPVPLDFRVLKDGGKEDEFQITADPADAAALEKKLKDWLEGHKWHPARWKQFEAEVRARGDGKVLSKVRV